MGLVEPLSPELVLVCPGLREQAVASLPPLPWETLGARRSVDVERRRLLQESLVYVARLSVPLLILLSASVLLTLVLTLLAEVVR